MSAPRTRECRRILVVDDEPLVRELITDTLRQEFGCAIEEASNGNEALRILAARTFDLITTDIQMPNGSGIALTKAVRTGGNRTPIVVVSSVATEAKQELAAYSPIRFLEKLEIDERLLASVESVLSDSEQLVSKLNSALLENLSLRNQTSELVKEIHKEIEAARRWKRTKGEEESK